MGELDENINYQNLSDIASYQKLVDSMAEQNSAQILPNAGPTHAAIAMAKLFDKTSHIAKLVVASFSGFVCDQPNYIASLKNAIEKGVIFQIIFLSQRNLQSSAYQLLFEAQQKGKNITFKDATPKFVTFLTNGGKTQHFATFDNNKFRYENDTQSFVAFFSFNNIENASFLSNIFDSEFQN